MFTANSMNCLTEALGLSLPGNGTTLATHADREALFRRAGRLIVELCHRWYGGEDPTALPRGIATQAAFANAMTLDIAMGGSTNTILHLLAAAREAEVDFDLTHIDALSRRVPQLRWRRTRPSTTSRTCTAPVVCSASWGTGPCRPARYHGADRAQRQPGRRTGTLGRGAQ